MEQLVPIEDVAKHFGVSLSTARKWVRDGVIPKNTYIKIGHTQRFALATIAETLLMAGAQGLPLYGVVATVYDLFKGDDDEDFDTVVRKTIGEELYSGPVNAVLGVDVASRCVVSRLY